jgi:hypothetical protein
MLVAAPGYLRSSASANHTSPKPQLTSYAWSASTLPICALNPVSSDLGNNVARSVPPFPSRTMI